MGVAEYCIKARRRSNGSCTVGASSKILSHAGRVKRKSCQEANSGMITSAGMWGIDIDILSSWWYRVTGMHDCAGVNLFWGRGVCWRSVHLVGMWCLIAADTHTLLSRKVAVFVALS